MNDWQQPMMGERYCFAVGDVVADNVGRTMVAVGVSGEYVWVHGEDYQTREAQDLVLYSRRGVLWNIPLEHREGLWIGTHSDPLPNGTFCYLPGMEFGCASFSTMRTAGANKPVWLPLPQNGLVAEWDESAETWTVAKESTK